MPNLDGPQFRTLAPGFLGDLPSFRRTVREKMTTDALDLSQIPDRALITMYQGGVYSHPAFGQAEHFKRVDAVKGELRRRNTIEDLAVKDSPREALQAERMRDE